MTRDAAERIADTARAMGYEGVEIEPDNHGHLCVWYRSWIGKHCVDEPSSKWWKRRKMHCGKAKRRDAE